MLRPGEDKYVELQINSTTNIESSIFLFTRNDHDLETNFILNKIYVHHADATISALKIKALDIAADRFKTVIISASISFPTLDERGRYTSNSERTDITQTSNRTVNVPPPLRLDEHLNNFYNTWFTPLTGMYAVVSGIIVGSMPCILNKIKKNQLKNKNSKYIFSHYFYYDQ